MMLSVGQLSWRAAVQLTLPKEHGSWALALEPVVFGLLVAPSLAGAALAAAVAGFFLRRPMKLALAGKCDARQPLALVCLAILALVFYAVAERAADGWSRPEKFLGRAGSARIEFADGRNYLKT